jgi:hypothetical protein
VDCVLLSVIAARLAYIGLSVDLHQLWQGDLFKAAGTAYSHLFDDAAFHTQGRQQAGHRAA